ncbi:MAG: hypothetical protein LQ340_004755 [Diploschistes diacapsis]|nr:MAG: hypothetical protein LQ340_004755 [Diploschistes diacapsis]
MDSMRSLNRSLPTSNQPSEELLRAFKAAAVSVTTLYREAVSGQVQVRSSGYQDALDDLLAFLDQRHLGLGDGEGWLVRQWATGRLEDRPTNQATQDQQEQQEHQEHQAASESDDDKEQDKEKSPSPIQPESSPLRQQPRLEAHKTEDPASQNPEPQRHAATVPTSASFAFESPHVYPKDLEMQTHDTATQSATRPEASPRTTRQSKKNNKQGHRAISARVLGSGGGSKRKFPYGEFFDISGIGDSKDSSSRSAKRGKMG